MRAISNYSKIFAADIVRGVLQGLRPHLLARAQQQERAVTEVDTYLQAGGFG